ncbi:hypothetical protein ACQR1I_19630 [Bradyrhizobium sp. HKCCYLS2038]|uniref:hypothetical protein n=1 Tax=unclassified Bradyrhizobium TaxID=2631580 RepID=UPI003EBC4AA4
MAKTKAASVSAGATLPEKFDLAAHYRLTLNRVVMNGPNPLRPSHDVVVTGAYAETIRDAIDSADKL